VIRFACPKQLTVEQSWQLWPLSGATLLMLSDRKIRADNCCMQKRRETDTKTSNQNFSMGKHEKKPNSKTEMKTRTEPESLLIAAGIHKCQISGNLNSNTINNNKRASDKQTA